MTQPDHVPLQASDRVRPSELLPPPERWHQDRPGDQTDLLTPIGPRLGLAAPDAGYGLLLARRLADRLLLSPGEHPDDVILGCFACSARRAAHLGRAPVVYDVEWSYTLWGLLGGAPDDLLAWRRLCFRGAAEDYATQRRIADAVRPEALLLSAAQVARRLGAWRNHLLV